MTAATTLTRPLWDRRRLVDVDQALAGEHADQAVHDGLGRAPSDQPGILGDDRVPSSILLVALIDEAPAIDDRYASWVGSRVRELPCLRAAADTNDVQRQDRVRWRRPPPPPRTPPPTCGARAGAAPTTRSRRQPMSTPGGMSEVGPASPTGHSTLGSRGGGGVTSPVSCARSSASVSPSTSVHPRFSRKMAVYGTVAVKFQMHLVSTARRS
jgi:hypothetical protein